MKHFYVAEAIDTQETALIEQLSRYWPVQGQQ